MTTTRRATRSAGPQYYPPAPSPSGGFVDVLFSALERRRLEAATEQLAEERRKLAEMTPTVATGSPDAIIATMTDELSRLPKGEWAKRGVKGCVVALRRDPDGRRVLAIAVPEQLTAARRNEDGWVRAVSSFCLFSGVHWHDEPREPLSPVFMFKEAP